MNYLIEWGQSCVDDQLTQLNVTPLEGHLPLDYLLYADALPRRNDGRVCDSLLKRYEHLWEGGWWCSGIDILTGNADIWGCFKPEQPRCSGDRVKPIKYEHPPKVPTGIFALRVSLPIWQRIADRYNLAIVSEDIKPDRPDLGFWEWVIDRPNLPLCITEGAKKAGALLTAGYAAIALPGVNGGYRVEKNEFGDRIGKSHLIPQLQKFATGDREIYLAFDQDVKATTIRAVNSAIKQTGYLLSRSGCSVKIISWNSAFGKGVDDLIATHGQEAFDDAYQKAVNFEIWKAQSWHRLTYFPDIQVNHRYLPDLPIPETAKLIAIKSPKGTGKTRVLEKIVKQARDRGKWVLVIGHRVRLVEALCQRFGLKYIAWEKEEKQNQANAEETSPPSPLPETGRGRNYSPFPSREGGWGVRFFQNDSPFPGYGLCIDSLHPQSQAAFNAVDWSDGVVIIDEVEQVLWHGLNSSTCSKNRVAILKSLKTLMQNVLGASGQVFVADADLSDISLDYLISLSGVTIQPYVILNDWKPDLEEAWTVYNYEETTPKQLVKDLEKHIREGGKPFVCLSAQKTKSVWGSSNLEAYLKRQFPKAKILRIDSESLADSTHPACGCATRLNEVLKNYDIVLASPSIETGVSIDIRGHFTSVWAIAQGVQSPNSVRQALGRVRENIPRYIWTAKSGFNQVGNGSTSIFSLLNSGERLTQLNIRLLQQADFAALDDMEIGFQAESLLCWAKMAVRLNSSMFCYRDSVLASLADEGHYILDAEQSFRKTLPITNYRSPITPSTLTDLIVEVRDQNYQAECSAIALAKDLSDRQYRTIDKQIVKTSEQRRSLRKYELKQRYCIPITASLVAKDDAGWYQKIRLHYFLTLGRPYLADRDAAVARTLIDRGNGNIFLPDFNRCQLGAIIGTLEFLGIPTLLRYPARKLKNTDEDLQAMAAIALKNRQAIKTVVGIGLALNSTPIVIVRRFLNAIGYGLECLGTESHQKKRLRVYRIALADDSRFEVFQQWLALETQFPINWESENAVFKLKPQPPAKSANEDEYIQLSLLFDV